jgi:DNA polymerase-3 subunit alpha
MSDFVHLHVHSDYSLLDGCAKIGRLLQYTSSLGMKSIALTDHGNMFGAIEFYEKAKAMNMKSIIGCECYLVVDHKNTEHLQRTRADDDDYGKRGGGSLQGRIFHMGLLAMDNTGYHNLIKLVSDAHLRGFYYKPRMDLETLARYSAGLIGFSGCMNGVIPQHLLHGEIDKAKYYLEKFLEIFGKERFIIELQDHGLEEQKRLNPMLLKLAKDYGLMAVCTNDSHYVEDTDAIPHDIMLCIQTGAKLADPDRMRFGVQEFFIKSPRQMEAIFGEEPMLLRNTQAIAERCNVAFDFKKNNYPRYHMTPEEKSKYAEHFALLHASCTAQLPGKYGVAYDPNSLDTRTREVSERLDYELAMIKKMGFVDYFLIVRDIVAWAVRAGIPISARGSAVGSMVSYLCDIGNTEPLKFKLFFERFLNPERISPPDIDLDVCMRRRGEVIDYIRSRYGNDNVAHIVTYGTFGAKMVIRDICRVKDVPFSEADRIAKMVPEGINPKTQHAWKLEDVAENPEFSAELKANPLAQEIYKNGTIIEGMTRSTGKHAAGILITEKPLVEYLPLTLQEEDITTQYDMRMVEKLGLLKMDLLGLKTLTVISDAVKLVREYAAPDFDLARAIGKMDDPRVFDIIRQGRTPGIFQLESSGMQNTLKLVGVTDINDVSAIIALYRPGPMQFIPNYAEGKKDPSKVVYPHPLMGDVLKETYGIMIYQEQVMEAAKILAGYSLGGADILRRAMGKKKIEEMEKQKNIFVEGCAKTNDIPKEKALELFALIEKFAGYGFNKSHSAAYAIVAYQTAYLKAYYPTEFMAAVLGCELGNADNVAKFIGECAAMGLRVLGPDINKSGLNFTPVGKEILFGLGAIKGVGEGGAAKIIEERRTKGPFKSFADFMSRLGNKAVNRRVVENIVKSGVFDGLGEERAYLIENLEELMKAGEKKDANQGMLFSLEEELPRGKAVDPLPFQMRLQYEKELLGFYLSGHPLDEYPGLASAINTADDLKTVEDKKNFRFCGVISDVTKKFSKRDNQPWALFKLSTQTNAYEMSLFSSSYAAFGGMLADGAVVVATGMVRDQNGEKRFSVDSLKVLRDNLPSLIKKVVFTIKGGASCLEWLKDLKKELLAFSGDTEVELIVAGEKALVVAQLPKSLKWRFDPQKFHQIAQSPCVVDIKAKSVEFVPPQKKPWEKNMKGNGGSQ